MTPSVAACKLTGLPECSANVQASCQVRLAALEQAVARMERTYQSLSHDIRDATAASREVTAASDRRSESLDSLARELRVGNGGIKLGDTGTYPTIPEKTP